MLPALIGARPRKARPSVDLPEPDSPTIPGTSPAATDSDAQTVDAEGSAREQRGGDFGRRDPRRSDRALRVARRRIPQSRVQDGRRRLDQDRRRRPRQDLAAQDARVARTRDAGRVDGRLGPDRAGGGPGDAEEPGRQRQADRRHQEFEIDRVPAAMINSRIIPGIACSAPLIQDSTRSAAPPA